MFFMLNCAFWHLQIRGFETLDSHIMSGLNEAQHTAVGRLETDES